MTSELPPTRVLPPARRSATALGIAVKAVRALPRPVQQAVLRKLSTGDLPPVADFVRILEIAGGMPDPTPSDEQLFAHSPQLRHVRVTEPVIDGSEGRVPARLYRNSDVGGEGPVALVWVHGGAFVSGSLDMAEAHWVSLALAARGIPVLSLSYRMSLRGVHAPASSDDVLAGWLWATEHADALGVPAGQLHLGGASAGANLAAGVAKRLRDGAGPTPASVVLAYPLVHPELPDPDPALLVSVQAAPGVVYFSPDWIADICLQHVGDPAALADPYTFPANGDLSGLGATFILNCELDTLRSSGEAYAEQLAASGVPVDVALEPGAGHGCLSEPLTDQGQSALSRIAGWLTAHGQR